MIPRTRRHGGVLRIRWSVCAGRRRAADQIGARNGPQAFSEPAKLSSRCAGQPEGPMAELVVRRKLLGIAGDKPSLALVQAVPVFRLRDECVTFVRHGAPPSRKQDYLSEYIAKPPLYSSQERPPRPDVRFQPANIEVAPVNCCKFWEKTHIDARFSKSLAISRFPARYAQKGGTPPVSSRRHRGTRNQHMLAAESCR